MTDFLKNGTFEKATILLAHGAGANSESPFMAAFAEGLAERGFAVARFEFPYMVERRKSGSKRPPDRAPKLIEAFRQAITDLKAEGPLIIGGKSMGGRIASMLAAETPDICQGLLCLGYPFHAPGKPDRLRTEHLADIVMPTLIVQGARDPFGGRDLVAGLELRPTINLHWAADGNHDLAPRKASGHTTQKNWATALDAIARFFG